MDKSTKATIEMAATLGKAGLAIRAIEVHTEDGRTWHVAGVPAGRGRRDDGSWGPRPGAPAGFRLFEIDRENDDAPNEHDAIDGDTWTSAELVDYLRAITIRRAPARVAHDDADYGGVLGADGQVYSDADPGL